MTINMLDHIKFDPKQHKTTAGSAKAFYKALLDHVTKYNQDSSYPMDLPVLWTPEKAEELGYNKNWMVSWEGGYDEWAYETAWNWEGAIKASPYHSFDLAFYEH